jgi:hypothetical protein
MFLFTLLAQAGAAPSSNDVPTGVYVFIAIAGGCAITITAIISGINFATKGRQLQHAERMKALEQGVPLDDIEEERRFRKGIMRLAGGIGVAVPICAVGAATGAVTGMGSSATTMVVFLVWTAAASVGVAGVASGAWLAQGAMNRLSPRGARGAPNMTSPYPRPYEAPEAAIAAR